MPPGLDRIFTSAARPPAGEPLLMSAGADNSLKQWVFDSADGAPRLLKFRSGHAAPPTTVCAWVGGRAPFARPRCAGFGPSQAETGPAAASAAPPLACFVFFWPLRGHLRRRVCTCGQVHDSLHVLSALCSAVLRRHAAGQALWPRRPAAAVGGAGPRLSGLLHYTGTAGPFWGG